MALDILQILKYFVNYFVLSLFRDSRHSPPSSFFILVLCLIKHFDIH